MNVALPESMVLPAFLAWEERQSEIGVEIPLAELHADLRRSGAERTVLPA